MLFEKDKSIFRRGGRRLAATQLAPDVLVGTSLETAEVLYEVEADAAGALLSRA